MPAATLIPTWLTVVLAMGTPSLTFVGVLLANWLSRKTASEQELRSRREETMRNLRWAAELAMSPESSKADLGLRELRALSDSITTDSEQQTFIDAAIAVVLERTEAGLMSAGDPNTLDVDVESRQR